MTEGAPAPMTVCGGRLFKMAGCGIITALIGE